MKATANATDVMQHAVQMSAMKIGCGFTPIPQISISLRKLIVLVEKEKTITESDNAQASQWKLLHTIQSGRA
ncbi:hypothetical protein B7994_11865 [Fibrobacter sp. UWR2]|nr:hypothetical protein B7994_11865 [Fibrobacter sp. UWR2]